MLTALLALALTSTSPEIQNADKLIVAERVRVASAPGGIPKEITPSCLSVPISTTPSGPTWSFEVNAGTTSSPELINGTFWRKPCSGSNGQLILTLKPVSGSPFVCSVRAKIIQNAQQIDNIFLETSPNNNSIDSLCADLFLTTSVVLDPTGEAIPFDDDAAFTFIYQQGSSNVSVNVAAFDPAAYGQATQDQAISGKLSGSYFDPSRSGEGVLLEIGRVGLRKSFFLSWYTYSGGAQRWVVGNVDFPAGATQITIPLIVTSGGQFGSAFNPTQVQRQSFGTAVVSFPTCSTMKFQWSEAAGGQSGTYNYQRLAEGLEGIACP